MKKLSLSLFILAFLASCNSCNNTTQPKQPDEPAKQEVKVNAPAFIADSAYAYTQKQVDFGPRNMNSKAHEDCGKWLIAQAKLFADTVYVQKFDVKGFDGKTLNCTNIIASFNPKATTRILLTTHWDSRPWADQDTKDRDKPILAACDGASGGATLLELARAIKSQPLGDVGVDLFLNDAEDYGYSSSLEGLVKPVGEPSEDSYCLGTQYWSRNPHIPGYHADFGILLDMAAARNALFTREGKSSYYAAWVQDMVWENAAALGYSTMFSNQNTPPITDDHVYVNQITNIPTIDIIHYDASSPSGTFPAFWHTHADDMSVIDKGTLGAVGKVLLYTIYKYDAEKKVVQ